MADWTAYISSIEAGVGAVDAVQVAAVEAFLVGPPLTAPSPAAAAGTVREDLAESVPPFKTLPAAVSRLMLS